MENLLDKKCQVCEYGDLVPLNQKEAKQYLINLPKWQLSPCGKKITCTFEFKGFYRTMSFVNAVAWIANNEGHHPDMEVSFNRCIIHFTTHSVDGLTENDFICAAKIDALL
ncbi:4a-hydroxytetrahydrobiopterin dehydratase [Fastidiosibacter lacustris]|uniref:4a-hydroxytetrahydrobiopterin dehydratase n=1 Tax=Fastidiosibacter lacustris TaxID=2056695 RepID=UPI000E34F01D|nr:4a-hydroxytetrahydrobiopterin dehydratase [Fastidiosibacter lacustris]